MPEIRPFAALRPSPKLAAQVCELPYDVMSSVEARRMAAGNPLSFLRVSKPEIDLPEETDPCDPAVYRQGEANFRRLIQDGVLRQDARPCFYLYRQVMGEHSQTGLGALVSCQDYLDQVVKKHELTRPDKEDDRVRHLEALQAQTGPAFLTFRAKPGLEGLWRRMAGGAPEVDFVAVDGIRHSSWVVDDPGMIRAVEEEFRGLPALYIADGHHRTAAAVRVWQRGKGRRGSGFFLAVIFPHDQLQVLPYNRVVKDLGGRSAAGLLEQLRGLGRVEERARPRPGRRHEVSFYLEGRWRSLTFSASLTAGGDPVARLDATLLQEHVLGPLFGVADPRTSERINFVGGIRGTGELEELVNRGGYACAFSLYPTSLEELMAVADTGGIMPPKSTWFEPKLRDAMFCHLL